MHELSLANSVGAILRSEMEKYPGRSLKSVTVSVGEHSGVEIEAFETALGAVIRSGRWPDAVAEIEIVESRAACLMCGAEFHPRHAWPECPKCGSGACGITAGLEFKVKSFTIA